MHLYSVTVIGNKKLPYYCEFRRCFGINIAENSVARGSLVGPLALQSRLLEVDPVLSLLLLSQTRCLSRQSLVWSGARAGSCLPAAHCWGLSRPPTQRGGGRSAGPQPAFTSLCVLCSCAQVSDGRRHAQSTQSWSDSRFTRCVSLLREFCRPSWPPLHLCPRHGGHREPPVSTLL